MKSKLIFLVLTMFCLNSYAQINDELIKAAYERMHWVVRASHILLKLDENALPKDTLQFYEKALTIRKRILDGEDFDIVAKQVSDDPSVNKNGGDLGFFTAFQMVYPFEIACFNLGINEISMPIRTKFGYHIIKVHEKKPNPGEIKVAHIMCAVSKESTPEQEKEKKYKVDDLYNKLLNKEDFSSLARQYSDDKSSAINGGELPWVGIGRMVPEFEKAAFALEKVGQISDPIRTPYGWHIIKLIEKKSVASLTDEHDNIVKKLDKIKDLNKYSTNPMASVIIPPIINTSNIKFNDNNGNGRIDGNEDCYISLIISNVGKGIARNLKVKVENNSNIQGLTFSNISTIGNINPNATQAVNVPISGTMNLTTGTANIKVSFEEQMGFQPDPFELNIETKEFIKPNVQIVDYSFLTDKGIIQLGLPIQLKVLIQNIGEGVAENVNVSFQYPNSNVFPNGPKDFEIGILQTGATKELVFEFIANKLYLEKNIPITAKINEKYGRFSENKQMLANIDAKSSGNTINIASNAVDSKVNIQVASLTSEVDKNIPINPIKYPDRYALIIGNEDYLSRQRGLGSEINVAFAVNDAEIFKAYCINTLGIEERNVFFLINATAGEMYQKIELVAQILSRLGSKGELIFYYAGHGFPDEKTKEPYLIPVDVTATNLSAAIKLNDVYKKFSQTGSKRISVFLDACFTGGGRESGLLAARGVKVRPKEEIVSGNMVIFAATSEDQSALPFKDKQHGMFTYFLLKKLQDTKGDVSYGMLEEYIRNNVSIESLKINSKAQDPKANVSPQAKTEWETWKLK